MARGQKTGGRDKGTPNKVTKLLRELVTGLTEDLYEDVLRDVTKLTPKERVDVWVKLLEYGLPKLQRVENKIDLSSLSNEDVDKLVDKILAPNGDN